MIYKCISKLLCAHHKVVLADLISQNQSAFVQKCEILYNIMICQDIIRGYQRKQISPRCILKINLQKAFDSVHWRFIRELLEAMKFLAMFTKWVMACITLTRFSVHLNCQICPFFGGGRGLRQGDPLSPLLFALIMEYFSRLMKTARNSKGFEFRPHCRSLKPSHLIFANDLIMFYKAEPHSLLCIKLALHSFQECAGLQANLRKSHIVFGGCSMRL